MLLPLPRGLKFKFLPLGLNLFKKGNTDASVLEVEVSAGIKVDIPVINLDIDEKIQQVETDVEGEDDVEKNWNIIMP